MDGWLHRINQQSTASGADARGFRGCGRRVSLAGVRVDGGVELPRAHRALDEDFHVIVQLCVARCALGEMRRGEFRRAEERRGDERRDGGLENNLRVPTNIRTFRTELQQDQYCAWWFASKYMCKRCGGVERQRRTELHGFRNQRVTWLRKRSNTHRAHAGDADHAETKTQQQKAQRTKYYYKPARRRGCRRRSRR